MIQIPPGFDYLQLFNDFVSFGLVLAPVAVLTFGFVLVVTASKRSGR